MGLYSHIEFHGDGRMYPSSEREGEREGERDLEHKILIIIIGHTHFYLLLSKTIQNVAENECIINLYDKF